MIACRARLSRNCQHGRHEAPGDEMEHDGTYRVEATGAPGTIVCVCCYFEIIPHTPSGMGLHYELDDAIRILRGRKAGLNAN